ncbi:histidine kinase/DNA gyrase B/HSP90-like ATPase [Roseivirga ehrenbergii]|uniref:histidine kinase n=1 Tax=Roseivirga ehrenbergii (strain DSM 102268 / JCM 13514 / KCTC 12282 / NCIMB 14502 / KMM 6017) TaxID=279360 RepID=A0A150XPB3_ROSEK|nr:ATP-binding protein [Roseivirga ehrenbergii]KYG80588.1 histidine kinase [Roseivirga ehrenbergii]TCL07834.1 histidine kinase/DNA gyrase B/HSP90-like ATPase [Roseivirga ehrenbergii]
MGFKNLRFNIIARVILLTASALLLANLIYGSQNQVNIFFVSLAIVVQVYLLIRAIEKTNREISGFLNSIKYDDFTATYPTEGHSASVDQLYQEFNNVIKKFREIRADKEANYHYFRTIVQHVGIGLITFNKKGDIQIINSSAKKLIGVEAIQNIFELSKVSPKLVESLVKLKTGGSDLIEFTQDGTHIQLSIYVIELVLRGEEFKLVSVQNIQSELEEKEMDAWQNLIRVLTHEIMNSVTPLSSLAATVKDNLVDNIEDDVPIEKDELEDIYLAVQTIERRSQGLIRFVSDFRNLTKIPQPKVATESVAKVLEHIQVLFNHELAAKNIKISFSIEPVNLAFSIDKELIDQVLINILQNAVHALEESTNEKHIMVRAFVNEYNRPTIVIRDNGCGIDEEALSKIFIPFFTTKKQGSGIGLSLSKQIMRKHGGGITVKSVMNEGTEFTLRF